MTRSARIGGGQRLVAVALVAVLIAAASPVRGGQVGKLFGRDKGVAYKVYRDPTNRFQIDYPEKELRPLPSGGSSLAVFSRNDGPAVFVDAVRLKEPLTPGELSQMAEMELERLKKQEPETKQFTSDVLESKSGRGVLVKYSRVGKGREWAVHYTIATGQDLFRVHGVVPEKLTEKFAPIVIHMLQSFKAPAEPPPPPSKS
jgi:hypothetical protein